MTQTIHAQCPHCQNVLRIPAEWASMAMRCKHCQKTFQAKANSSKSANVAIAAPASVAKPAAAIPVAKAAATIPTAVAAGSPPPAAAVPIGKAASTIPTAVAAGTPPPPVAKPFAPSPEEGPEPVGSVARRRGKNRGLVMLVVMFFFLFLLGAGGAAIVVYKAINMPGGPSKQIARGDGTRGENAPVRPNPSGDGPNEKKKGNINDDNEKDPPPSDLPLKKKELPKKEGPKVKPPVFSDGVFPRRALLINSNNYLFYNTVHYGSGINTLYQGYPGSSTSVLRDRFTRPPMYFPATQVTELSDGVPPENKVGKSHSTQKSVLETTIKDFTASARTQDRIVLFYAGHAASVDDKSYLVPIDGNLKEVSTLVPLSWVYDQLAACKAQQKILILDVFRYSPSRGFELPSTGDGEDGAMPEGFEKDATNPPAGVQVWCACSKHKDKEEMIRESSIELEGGSAFMQALCNSLQGGSEMKGISDPSQPIPIESLVESVNKRLTTLLIPEKKVQISVLSGKAGTAVPYDKEEALPVSLALKPPTVGGGGAAPFAVVDSILGEVLLRLPAVRETRATDANLLKARNLPAFGIKKLEFYKPDGYSNVLELQNRYKTAKDAFAKDFPLRAAVFDSIEALEESNQIKMFEVQRSPVTPQRKKDVMKEQELLGVSTFKLEQALTILKEAGDEREKETSKRWLANYDYTLARLQSRLVYLIEYNYILGRVRADDLPELAQGQSGWRIGTGKKIAVTEKKAKDYAKSTKKLWDKIVDQYPDTPWSLLAQREREITLGLQWRPKSD